jgi:hypothetical protein
LRAALQRLSSHIDTPGPGARGTGWDQWIAASELDAQIAGWIVSALAGAPVDRRDLDVARKTLLANGHWQAAMGHRYGDLVEGVELLLKKTTPPS